MIRTLIVGVWRAFKLIHCQKGMHWCTVVYIKLIDMEAKHVISRNH